MSQCTDALKLATQVRQEKGAVKEAVKGGRVDPVDVILHTTLPFTVKEVLMAVPSIGITKAKRLARYAGVNVNRRVASRRTGEQPLAQEERIRLANTLRLWQRERDYRRVA